MKTFIAALMMVLIGGCSSSKPKPTEQWVTVMGHDGKPSATYNPETLQVEFFKPEREAYVDLLGVLHQTIKTYNERWESLMPKKKQPAKPDAKETKP